MTTVTTPSITDRIRAFIATATDRFTARGIEEATGIAEARVRPILIALVELGEIEETTGERVKLRGRPRKAYVRAK